MREGGEGGEGLWSRVVKRQSAALPEAEAAVFLVTPGGRVSTSPSRGPR